MALPDWMKGYPGAPQPAENNDDTDEQVGIRPHRPCGSEGCDGCENTGVIYP
ncbi:hypothetical protein [Streptomyces lasiicapitis]|uniref:hypothetical protein n=1 Tax=Streptomyces lasiicapitis TaxID=1923961 RepID=UPI0036AC1D96